MPKKLFDDLSESPAQALGYKLRQLNIQRLRRQAQAELGSHYDVRAFHDEILNGGALPLYVAGCARRGVDRDPDEGRTETSFPGEINHRRRATDRR